MGAQLWYHVGPWRADPAESLREVQIAHLRANYRFSSLLAKHLESARQAVELTATDDPYNLHDSYRAEVAHLERLAVLPRTTSADERIHRLRELFKFSGQGIGCVIDVQGVSDAGGLHVARRLTPAEIATYCGSERPTRSALKLAPSRINADLNRGESVCFPIYSQAGNPFGWCFVGNTID